MNVLAVIPARYASTRLPGKPLADIAGKSMVRRVYEQTRKARLVSDVVVATDDRRIADEVMRFGGTARMTPEEIRSGSDRIALVARGASAEIVVNVQGDEPLIDPALIDQTVQTLLERPEAVVATAVKRIADPADLTNPNVVKAVLDRNGFALYFSRSAVPFLRDAQPGVYPAGGALYYKHFGIYVYRADFLQTFAGLEPTPLEQAEKLEQLRILEHGYRIACAVTEYESFPVDTPEDLRAVTERVHRTTEGR